MLAVRSTRPGLALCHIHLAGRSRVWAAGLLVLSLVACGGEETPEGPADAGLADVQPRDLGGGRDTGGSGSDLGDVGSLRDASPRDIGADDRDVGPGDLGQREDLGATVDLGLVGDLAGDGGDPPSDAAARDAGAREDVADLGAPIPLWSPAPLGHPRLYFGADELDTLRERASSPEEPFSTFARRMRALAARPPEPLDDPEEHDSRVLLRNGNIAKAAAAVALLLDDAAAADTARSILASFQVNPETLPLAEYDQGTIQSSTGLLSLSVAFDLMMAGHLLEQEEAAAAAARIGELAERLEDHYLGRFRWLIAAARNNHVIKLAAGLGMAGLVLPEDPRAVRWVVYAQTVLDDVLLGTQLAGEGGFAEGPNYLRYSAESYLPYLLAFHRLHGGELHSYPVDCRFMAPDCVEEERVLGDLAQRPELELLHRWVLAISMPDGATPNIDDSRNVSFAGGLTGHLHRDPELIWHWEHTLADPRSTSGGSELSLENLVAFDPALVAVSPEPRPVDLRPGAGTAVLRSGWTPEASWALLLGEHGAARQAGIGHEQLDATSFSYASHGQYLLLDPGYPGYQERFDTALGHDHNLVLVDGQGPPQGLIVDPGVDAFLSEGPAGVGFWGASVSARYQGVDVAREMVMLEDGSLVVATEVRGEEPHRYEHLLHTFAGGDTGEPFELLEQGARFERGGVSVELWVDASAGLLEHRTHEDEHSVQSQRGVHAVLSSGIEARTVVFLAVAVPSIDEEGAAPRLASFAAGEGRAGVSLSFEDEQRDPWYLVAAEQGHREDAVTLPSGDTLPCAGLLTVLR